jgi:hypothetical protein
VHDERLLSPRAFIQKPPYPSGAMLKGTTFHSSRVVHWVPLKCTRKNNLLLGTAMAVTAPATSVM